MLNGINVINTLTETHQTAGVLSLIGAIFLGIMAICCFTIVIITTIRVIKNNDVKNKDLFIMVGFIAMMSMLFCGLMLNSYINRKTYTTTKYQVTIDDSVKYNELTSRYDIISHEGNVYIIQDKLENEIKQ